MTEIPKVATHRLVVGATPDVMEAARSAAAEVARDFYADAIRKGRCDSDEIVLVAARAILAERERCAKVAERDVDWAAFGKRDIEQWDGGPDAVRDYRIGIAAGRAIAAAIRGGDTP